MIFADCTTLIIQTILYSILYKISFLVQVFSPTLLNLESSTLFTQLLEYCPFGTSEKYSFMSCLLYRTSINFLHGFYSCWLSIAFYPLEISTLHFLSISLELGNLFHNLLFSPIRLIILVHYISLFQSPSFVLWFSTLFQDLSHFECTFDCHFLIAAFT